MLEIGDRGCKENTHTHSYAHIHKHTQSDIFMRVLATFSNLVCPSGRRYPKLLPEVGPQAETRGVVILFCCCSFWNWGALPPAGLICPRVTWLIFERDSGWAFPRLRWHWAYWFRNRVFQVPDCGRLLLDPSSQLWLQPSGHLHRQSAPFLSFQMDFPPFLSNPSHCVATEGGFSIRKSRGSPCLLKHLLVLCKLKSSGHWQWKAWGMEPSWK